MSVALATDRTISWGVLLARPSRNRRVAEALSERGVEFFQPMIETLRVVNGRHRRDRHPLLGKYIPIVIAEGWQSLIRLCDLSGTSLVSGILLNEAGMPALVQQREIESLRESCDGDLYRSIVPQQRSFCYGQRVMVNTGPFSRQVGRYDNKTKRGDAALFMLFGREQRVVFKRGELIAA